MTTLKQYFGKKNDAGSEARQPLSDRITTRNIRKIITTNTPRTIQQSLRNRILPDHQSEHFPSRKETANLVIGVVDPSQQTDNKLSNIRSRAPLYSDTGNIEV